MWDCCHRAPSGPSRSTSPPLTLSELGLDWSVRELRYEAEAMSVVHDPVGRRSPKHGSADTRGSRSGGGACLSVLGCNVGLEAPLAPSPINQPDGRCLFPMAAGRVGHYGSGRRASDDYWRS
jgi:hypothetical protein